MILQKCTVTVSSHVWKWIQLGMAVWIVMDIVFDVLQIRTYYRMSPYWNHDPLQEFNQDSTTLIINLCKEFEQKIIFKDGTKIKLKNKTQFHEEDDFKFMDYWARDCSILLTAER